jgi:hypothetical protein
MNETNQPKPQTVQNKQPPASKPDIVAGIHVQGFLKIHDPESKEVFVDKKNAIHYENISMALAYCLANKNSTNGSYIFEMRFGNGGSSIDPTGVITYLPPNTNTQNSDLYNPTYSKIVDDTSSLNTNPAHNNVQIRHTPGAVYTDILISCLLDYGEPAGQAAFDNSQTLKETYTFDELGLVGRDLTGAIDTVGTGTFSSDSGPLLTHVIFHPVQKSLNRLIQIDYTVRIQTLTNLSSIA